MQNSLFQENLDLRESPCGMLFLEKLTTTAVYVLLKRDCISILVTIKLN